jgi:hypothetical protein
MRHGRIKRHNPYVSENAYLNMGYNLHTNYGFPHILKLSHKGRLRKTRTNKDVNGLKLLPTKSLRHKILAPKERVLGFFLPVCVTGLTDATPSYTPQGLTRSIELLPVRPIGLSRLRVPLLTRHLREGQQYEGIPQNLTPWHLDHAIIDDLISIGQ